MPGPAGLKASCPSDGQVHNRRQTKRIVKNIHTTQAEEGWKPSEGTGPPFFFFLKKNQSDPTISDQEKNRGGCPTGGPVLGIG